MCSKGILWAPSTSPWSCTIWFLSSPRMIAAKIYFLMLGTWMMGVVAGPSSSVQHVVHLQDLGPSLGLHLNPPKCELFSQGDLSLFPSDMKKSCTPNLTILGTPIGDVAFCSSCITSRRAAASVWLSSLEKLILRLLSFCYACVVDLLNWSTLHGPLLHPWH